MDEIGSDPLESPPAAPSPSAPPPPPLPAAAGEGSSTALPAGLQKLDPRWISMRRVFGWIRVAVYLVLWIIATLILTLSGPAPWILVTVVGAGALWVVLMAVQAHLWPALSWRRAAYRLSERDLEIRRGVLWREVVTVPRSRVQHTDVSQGPIERSFGLGTLLIHTAGTDHSRIGLPGLAHDTASVIRDHLVEVDEDDGV